MAGIALSPGPFCAPDGRDLRNVRHGRAKSPERLDRGAFRLEDVRFVLLEFGETYTRNLCRRGNAGANRE